MGQASTDRSQAIYVLKQCISSTNISQVTVQTLSIALATGSEAPDPRRVSTMVRAKSKAVAGPWLVTKLPGTSVAGYVY
jgi:hypothetical protein